MSKYAFKITQRYAVFKAFDGLCPWCKEPVEFKASHIDHVLPEELLNDPPRLQQVLKTFGLPSNFNINDYENWMPAHSYCNLEKNKKVYEGAPFIRTILDKCASNKQSAQLTEIRLNREPLKAKLITELQDAIERNFLNIYELQNLAFKSDIMNSNDEELNEIKRLLNDKVEYQNKQMLHGLLNMMRTHTQEILGAMAKELGPGWAYSMSGDFATVDGFEIQTLKYGLVNQVDKRIDTTYLRVAPRFSNTELIIDIKDSRKNEIKETIICDIAKGVDWTSFRAALRKHHKVALLEQLKKSGE